VPHRFRLLVLTILAALAAAPAAQASGRSAPRNQYYLSLGDSYAVGYQAPVMRPTRNGPANQLVGLAAKRGYRYRLINLGCAGATTASMLDQVNCPAAARAPGAPAYPGQTQVQAAVAFIKKHPGRVGLVTVSIGGNDIDGCIATEATALACVTKNMPAATANLTKIVKRLRAAGPKRMRIIGSTYPDVALGAWVLPSFGADRFTLVSESLTAFAKLINPGLKKAYSSVGAKFVDVTAATGAYGRFNSVATGYGPIPAPVAEVCKLTYFCNYVNIHMTTAGYGIIAKLEAATLPRVVTRKS
jgi:lysophospholipase L1-like esterase